MKHGIRRTPIRQTPYQVIKNGGDLSGRHDPKAFIDLAHFFKMEEIVAGGSRVNAIDYITGMSMDVLFQDKPLPSSDHLVATSPIVNPPLKDSGYHTNNQPDHGGSGGIANQTCSQEFRNLKDDDWMFMGVGNNLTTNLSGTVMTLGLPPISANPSFISLVAATIAGDTYAGPIACVSDTLGNEVIFPEAQPLSGGRFAGIAAPLPGAREPFVYALFREGNKITRYISPLLTGEQLIDTVDCSNLAGDVHPSAGWWWADFITYGHLLFHFTQGTPSRIKEYIDWMAYDWSNNPLNKKIHPNLLVHL